MNLGQIKSRVKRDFGDESGAEITDADIVDWANEGQIHIVRKTKALAVHKETAVVSGQRNYLLPTDLIFLDRVTYKGTSLEGLSQDQLDTFEKSLDASTGTGVPSHYYVYGRDLFLYPSPNESLAGGLDIFYIKSPTALAADVDVPEIPIYLHKELVTYCVMRAKGLDEESTDAQMLELNLDKELTNARDEVTSIQDDSYPAVRLLPGDYQ